MGMGSGDEQILKIYSESESASYPVMSDSL